VDGYIIALIVLLTYLIILAVGHLLKLWEKLNISLWGPIIIWKTVRGRTLIERIASRHRFWNIYGRISIGICLGAMILLMILLIWEAFIVMDIPRAAAPPPELMIGIPGINPIIPVWYGILGLVVAIFVHEFAHGILTRVGKMKIESLGILLLVVPIGAFVEPNEEELKAATRRKRTRLFAVGPATNIFVAFICLVLLLGIFAPSANPVYDGAIVLGITSDSPAEKFDIYVWSEIIEVDSTPVANSSDLMSISFDEPGEPVSLSIFYRGNRSVIELPAGVVVSPVSGEPADNAGIRSGMIVSSLNDRVIHNLSEFKSVLESAPFDIPINITVLEYGDDPILERKWFVQNESITDITLISKWEYYETHHPDLNKEEYRNVSRMGVTSSVFGVRTEDSDFLLQLTAHPFADIDGLGDFLTGSLRFIALPFWGFSPISSPMADLYQPVGVLEVLPDDIYWVIVNSLYWIFWLNLMIGIFNALPAVPLDGGYIFREFFKGALERFNKRLSKADRPTTRKQLSEEQMDRIVSRASIFISLTVLFLIIWQLVGPRIS